MKLVDRADSVTKKQNVLEYEHEDRWRRGGQDMAIKINVSYVGTNCFADFEDEVAFVLGQTEEMYKFLYDYIKDDFEEKKENYKTVKTSNANVPNAGTK